MPKQTFFNLSEDKVDTIMNAVIDEFALYDYEVVSITKICKSSNIAKGSFYQYFTDKKDLYSYLLKYISNKKKTYFSKYQNNDMSDTFEFLRTMYATGIKFSYENPKLYQILKYFINLSDDFKKELLGDLANSANDYLANMFEEGKKSGLIRKELDSKFIAKLVTDMSNSVNEYYFELHDKKDIDKETFLKAANEMIDILEKGIKED